MRRITEKLHSTSGASMLLALLFMLLAMTVGAVVLTAASVSGGRTARNQRDQQNALAVESAARLLQEDLREVTLTGAYCKEDYTEIRWYQDAEGNTYTETYNWTTYDPGKVAVKLENSVLLPAAFPELETLYCSTLTVPELRKDAPTADGMTYPLSFTSDQLPDVEGVLWVDTKSDLDSGRVLYTISAVLKTEDGNNAVTLVFQPKVTPSQITETKYEGGNPSCVISTYTTTVTWDTPSITKGELQREEATAP